MPMPRSDGVPDRIKKTDVPRAYRPATADSPSRSPSKLSGAAGGVTPPERWDGGTAAVGAVSHATAARAGAGAQVARHARVRRVKSLWELASREGVDSSYVSRMVNLTTLASDIAAVILDDTLPPVLTLFDFAADPPALWESSVRVD
jgi:hypothetical protein